MTQLFRNCREWMAHRPKLKSKSLGFIPTMGALHDGHLSVVSRSKAQDDVTLVSLFVNQPQFDDPDDFKNYPRTLEADVERLKKSGVDFVLSPRSEEMYEDGYRYRVVETEISKLLCGAHRPGHFDGVLTVVLKLLNLAQAQRAYFGEKDFQQLALIREMAKTFFLPTEIVAVPTVREKDGLAMSSRNRLLSKDERARAPRFHDILKSARTCEEAVSKLEQEGFKVDYVEERWGRRLGAVHLGKVRLIDNV